MSDFLLELFSEEIPARMQAGARTDLERLFKAQLDAAGLKAERITTYSTPRRLALIASGLPAETEAVSEETKGPREGAPPQALEGFCRKLGMTPDQLELRDGVYFAVVDKPGQPTAVILGPAIANIVREFPWPKSMRWGAASASSESMKWVRPLHRIVAMLGAEIVPVEIEGVSCGAASLGHRFHHPGEITFGGAHDYVDKLKMAHVLVDHEERQNIIRKGAADAAAKAGHELIEDEGLVIENAGLTEWPVPLLGSFDPDFLDVPEEVIQLTARLDQKYFVMRGKDGRLAPSFVLTSNIESSDPAAVIAGNERVLTARLSDARFFWENDLKVPLESLSGKLGDIVFHEKLGTVADKVDRIAKLARWLAEEKIVDADPDTVERAARLAKNDLVTGMVGEFPELQGIIGGHLARAQGAGDAVADAVRDHYKPVGQGDEVPTAPVTVAVSLADKLDNIAEFFRIGELPTGSKDPFALRRSALGVGSLIVDNGLRVSLVRTLAEHMGLSNSDAQILIENGVMEAVAPTLRELGPKISESMETFQKTLKQLPEIIGRMQRTLQDFPRIVAGMSNSMSFFADRLKVQQKEAGVRHDLIDAVFALGGEDDLVRLLARVKALQAFMDTEDGANLHAAYKRAANILKKEEWDPNLAKDYQVEAEEQALLDALDSSEPVAVKAIENEDFAAAMGALSNLRGPIDAFFDKVTVNADDVRIRARRLSLLSRFRDAVGQVADFSKIEG